MYPAALSKAKVVYKEPLFVNEDHFFMTVFVFEAPMGKNTSLECIRTVPFRCHMQRLGVKFQNCTNTKRMSADTKRTANDTRRIPAHPAKRQTFPGAEIFLHSVNSTCSKIKI